MARRLRTFFWLCAALALVGDVIVNVFVIRDGAFGYRALPPYLGTHHPLQKRWLAEQQEQLANDRRPGATGAFDPELGWTNVASSGTGAETAVPYNYDALGARSQREHAPEPPEGVLRLACFGESFTHGDEVGDLDTWCAQLEALDPRLEALNFGVGGYGADQALLRMRREGLHGARVALMGFMVENVGRNVNRYRPLWHPRTNACVAKPRFLLRGGELVLVPIPYATRAELVAAVADDSIVRDIAEHEHWIAESRYPLLRWSATARLGVGFFAYRRREIPRLYADEDGEPFVVSLALLEAFSREAKALGAHRSLVVFFPRRDELVSGEAARAPYWTRFVEQLRERGVEVLDLTEPMVAAVEAARPDVVPRMFRGSHYSREGNAVVAREVKRWVDAAGL